ncbi:hypothetical protein FF011L_32510 [Roseimaritima multifibrata]|uniref:DUF883 domain-containing protein n=1 Tax=Roseimaritima multifibrata TaxID=1930274 RepID=A0A517MHX0_9BACT|nr:hypothetical protein [Roseimaritima multifibrata]QDS94472.1 hypothetical protein FF011L_32510 [Roseimaritima multifibrata]
MSEPITPDQNDHMASVKDAARRTATRAAQSAVETSQDYAEHYVAEPAKDLFSLAKEYAKEKPDVAAMWAFGLGIIVGWKLKP